MGFKDLFKKKKKVESETDSKPKKQKRFYCSNCDGEVFLTMKFCDNCGGEIEWPEEYQYIIEYKPEKKPETDAKKKNDSSLKAAPIPGR